MKGLTCRDCILCGRNTSVTAASWLTDPFLNKNEVVMQTQITWNQSGFIGSTVSRHVMCWYRRHYTKQQHHFARLPGMFLVKSSVLFSNQLCYSTVCLHTCSQKSRRFPGARLCLVGTLWGTSGFHSAWFETHTHQQVRHNLLSF